MDAGVTHLQSPSTSLSTGSLSKLGNCVAHLDTAPHRQMKAGLYALEQDALVIGGQLMTMLIFRMSKAVKMEAEQTILTCYMNSNM